MNNISRTDLRVTSPALYHFIWAKLASYHMHTATRQNKSLVLLIKDIVPEIGYITIII